MKRLYDIGVLMGLAVLICVAFVALGCTTTTTSVTDANGVTTTTVTREVDVDATVSIINASGDKLAKAYELKQSYDQKKTEAEAAGDKAEADAWAQRLAIVTASIQQLRGGAAKVSAAQIEATTQ